MTTKRTPTPWEYEESFDGLIYGPKRVIICEMNPALTPLEQDPDAKHIVNCVNTHGELVSALEKIKDQCDDICAQESASRRAAFEVIDFLNIITSEALAKAKGEAK